MVYNPWGFVHVSLAQCWSAVSAIGIGVLNYSQPPVTQLPKKLLCFYVQFIIPKILMLLATKKIWRCFACIHLWRKRTEILLLLHLYQLTKPDQPAIHYWTEKAKISLNLNSPVVLFSNFSFINMPTFHLLNNWHLPNCKHTFHHLKSPQISLCPLLLHPWRAAQ